MTNNFNKFDYLPLIKDFCVICERKFWEKTEEDRWQRYLSRGNYCTACGGIINNKAIKREKFIREILNNINQIDKISPGALLFFNLDVKKLEKMKKIGGDKLKEYLYYNEIM